MPQPESYDLTMNPGTREQREDNLRAVVAEGTLHAPGCADPRCPSRLRTGRCSGLAAEGDRR